MCGSTNTSDHPVAVFLLALSVILSGLPAAADPGTESTTSQTAVVYGADKDFPPFEWVSEDGTLQGFTIDLVDEIARMSGIKVKFVNGSWSDIRKGQTDGWIDITTMFKSAERERHLAFSDTLAVGYDNIWIRKGDSDVRSLNDLAGKTVLVQKNGFEAEYLAANHSDVRLLPVDSEPRALMELAAGRGDCAIVSELTARTAIRTMSLSNIRRTGMPVLPRQLAFAVSRDRTQLLDQINQALALMRADGRYYHLESAWLEVRPTYSPAETFFKKYGWYVVLLVVVSLLWLGTWTLLLRRRVSARTRQLEDELNERIRTEEDLRRSEQIFNLLFSANPLLMGLSTLETGKYREVNPEFTRVTGYSRNEAIGISSVELGLWDNPDDRQKIFAEVAETGFCRNREVVLRNRSGRRLECILNVELVEIQGEKLAMTIVNDISDLREAERERARLENQLRQVQKIEMAGRLAGGVAHDFNNQLTIIRGYCDILSKRIAGSEDTRVLDEIRKAVDHSTSLTTSLLAFSRRQVRRLEVLNPAAVVQEMKKTIGVMLGENVSLVIDASESAGTVEMDRSQLEQVIINIVANARDAMGSRGVMAIEVHDVTIESGKYIANVEAAPGRYVVISMSDDGVGMNEETQKLVFEPFFTTKEIGKGTGLGLSIVYGIIKQNGGHIELISAPGEGSTFKLFIPRVTKEPSVIEETPGVFENSTGHETVLLVEDEAGLFELLSGVLASAGYDVLAADRPGVAVRMAAANKPDILVTDVVMPEMSGKDLAAQVKAIHPDIRILYMSGYPRDTITAHGILSASVDLLNKPFSIDEFLSMVRRVLDATPHERQRVSPPTGPDPHLPE